MERIIASARGGTLKLGRQGENEAREIAFDISRWNEIYGKGTASLVHARCGDEYPYPCNITVEDDGLVVWVIKNADVAKDGIGKCELTYAVDGVVVKSVIWDTYVASSLTDVTEEVPEPALSWVDRVIEIAAQSGKSAYNIAQDNGFTGTEQEWLISLKGETGAIGPQGERGEPGQNGVSSWPELKGKPFDVEVISLGDTLEWDGTPSDVVVNFAPYQYHLVSDNSLTVDDLIGGSLVLSIVENTGMENQEELPLTDETVIQFNDNLLAVVLGGVGGVLPIVAITDKDDVTYSINGVDIKIPQKGIYFIGSVVDDGVIHTSSLATLGYNFTKTVIKPIDPRVLPQGGVGYEEFIPQGHMLTIDPKKLAEDPDAVIVSNTYILASGATPSLAEWEGAFLTIGESEVPVFARVLTPLSAEVVWIFAYDDTAFENVIAIIIPSDNYDSSDTVTFQKKGIYIVGVALESEAYTLTLPNYEFVDTVLHKIDKKFLPDDIGGLPEVTAEDNGKFVQVVDGAYKLVALTDTSVEGA